MWLHYPYCCSCLFYCKIVLDGAIVVDPNDICDATPEFVGILKGLPGAFVTYQVLLLETPRSPFSPPPRSNSMES